MPLKVKISDFSPVTDLNSEDLISIIRNDVGSKKNKNVTVLDLKDHILGVEDGSGIQVLGSSGITGSLSITNDITCSGNLKILGAIVNTLIISSSQVDIDDNRILLNAFSPHERYTGIDVYDSGSNNVTSSFLWDSLTNEWGLTNLNASGYVSASTIRASTSVTSPIGNFTNLTASNITASGYVSASVINISPTKFSITDASEFEAGAANSLVIRHTFAGTTYPALFISQSGITSKIVINSITSAVYPPGGTAELTVNGEIASTAAIFSSASIAKSGYFNTIEPVSSTFHGLSTLNITASNITASGFVSASNVVINETLVNGSSNVALGTYSHAEGFFTIASGVGSHTEGAATKAIGNYSHAEGLYTSASGIYSHAEGQATWAQGERTHAEGYQTTASGDTSHAEGNQTTALGIYSHAEGYQTIASESFSHSEGNLTTASGFASHAEGQSTRASGQYSHAEGGYAVASGSYSHVEGFNTTASGNYSHAEGRETLASGSNSHAEGSGSLASGHSSHAEGMFTTASGVGQHVSGKFNVASANSNDLFIIGNGTSAARSNILVVNTSSVIVGGNISASGDLTASNILINGGSINKVEKFLGLNTSSFGTGTLTNERSKTTDDVIYTSASVDYLLHVHHNSASLQIYNLQTRNLVSNVSLTSGKNPNSIYLEGNKAFVGCYGSGSIAIVDISNINSPTTTYASSLTATSYTDDNNFVDPIVFKGNFIFGNISSVKIYNTSSVTSVSSTGVGTRITALHAYTSASVDVLLVLGYGSAGSAGTAFLFAYNITTPSAPVLMSQAPVLNTVLQPLPTAAERFCALTVDRENKYAYVGDSTSNVDDTILRVFDLSDLNFIKTIAQVKLNNGYYPFGTPVINRVSLTSYNTVLVTDTTNKRTFEFDLYDIKKQNDQLVVPIKIYTFNDTPTSVKFFKQQLSEDVIVVSTLNGNISFQNKSNKFIINSVNSDGTDSKNSILSLNNFTANISGSLIVSDNINCKTTINASELQFPNHSKIKSDSNYIRTLSSNHVIISEPTLGYNAAFYDYCVYSGSNIRAGVIAAAFSAGTVFYNETTTADIGNTEQVTMSVTCSGDFIQLLSNASTNVSWSIKAMARYI